MWKGWVPTFFGYSAQGMFKFGLYEVSLHDARYASVHLYILLNNCMDKPCLSLLHISHLFPYPSQSQFFKDFYSNVAGEEKSYQYRGLIYLLGSASAEFFADAALCPMEMVKVCDRGCYISYFVFLSVFDVCYDGNTKNANLS